VSVTALNLQGFWHLIPAIVPRQPGWTHLAIRETVPRRRSIVHVNVTISLSLRPVESPLATVHPGRVFDSAEHGYWKPLGFEFGLPHATYRTAHRTAAAQVRRREGKESYPRMVCFRTDNPRDLLPWSALCATISGTSMGVHGQGCLHSCVRVNFIAIALESQDVEPSRAQSPLPISPGVYKGLSHTRDASLPVLDDRPFWRYRFRPIAHLRLNPRMEV
jgi:hypothetical protein